MNIAQMTNDERDANDSQALTGGDVTKYTALVARISYLSQDRPDLKFASMQVFCAMVSPSVCDVERVKRVGRHLAGKPWAKCWFRWQQSGELEAYSDTDWGADKVTRRSVSAGVNMRGRHCLKVWTKMQHMVSLSTAESEPVRRSPNRIRRAGDAERGKTSWDSMWAEPASGCLSDNVLWSIAEGWARRSTSTCRICGYRRHPSRAGSSRRKSARA